MRKLTLVVSVALVLAGIGLAVRHGVVVQARPEAQTAAASSGQAPTPADLDGLLAPIALYPDSAPGADAAVRDGSRRRDGARPVLEEPPDPERHRPAGCRPEGQLRAELRGSGPLSADRESDGQPAGVDDPARSGIHRRSDGGVREHPAAEKTGARCRDPQDHPAAGSRNADDVDRSAGDRHRAGEPAGRVRAAIQPADGLRPARPTTVVVQATTARMRPSRV